MRRGTGCATAEAAIAFATVGIVAVACRESRITRDAAGASTATSGSIGCAWTNVATHAAVCCVRRDVRFTTVRTRAIAIAQIRSARRTHAARTILRRRARHVASSAIGAARRRIDFATIAHVAVAIGLSEGTSIDTRSGNAEFAHGTRHVASAAMQVRRGRIGFTTIGVVPVAIAKTSVACTERTSARRARFGSIGEVTRDATATTIRQSAERCFAAIVGVAVAIGKTHRARRDAISRRTCRRAVRIRAGFSARTAIGNRRQLRFTTIREHRIAITKVRIARSERASSRLARPSPVRIRAHDAAHSAVRDRGVRIRFATIVGIAITARKTHRA